MANLSLYDLAVLQRNDPFTGLVEDVTTLAPEFSTFAAVPREGTWYEIVKRIVLPTAQFRQPNVGTTTSKSVYKKEVKQMFYVDTQLQMDEAIWKADDASVGPAWQLEAKGAMQSASILLGQQTYYGTSADASGFQGIRAQLSGSVAAGGTTSSTSAYLCWMDGKEGCRYDVGNNGAFAITPPMRQQVVDANNAGKTLFAYVGNLNAWVGFNVQSNLSLWAVTGITTHKTSSTYDQGLTDFIAQDLVAQIPKARRNNLRWFMNRTSEAILQQSRSTIGLGMGFAFPATTPSGGDGRPAFAPMPTQLAGYPITVTDSVLNTETNS